MNGPGAMTHEEVSLMSTEIVRTGAVEFTPQQIALVKRTICKPKRRPATADELALFIGQAKRTGLDPFAKQIYAVFRWSSQDNAEVMSIQTGIDGFRVIAERTGSYLGQEGPFWCGPDGVWREIWTDTTAPVAAKVLVKKVIAGNIATTPAVAHTSEYMPTKNGKPMGLWKQGPAFMIAKCAEALALRKAFPNDLGGLYVKEEMDRADADAPAVPLAPSDAAALDVSPSISEDDAKELIAAAERVGVADQLPLAVSNMLGDEIGEITPDALTSLTEEQAADLGQWIELQAQPADAEAVA